MEGQYSEIGLWSGGGQEADSCWGRNLSLLEKVKNRVEALCIADSKAAHNTCAPRTTATNHSHIASRLLKATNKMCGAR